MDRKGERRARRRARLRDMRLHLVLGALVLVLASAGLALVREAMLRNTYETGTTLSRIYAAEEAGDLTVYETLLTVATTSIDSRTARGESGEEIAAWLEAYFQRLDSVLGSGAVDPYAVLEGQVVADDPWEGGADDPVEDTEWYQKAIAADGQAVFTDVYIDAVTGQPVITAAQKCRESGAVVAFDIRSERSLFGFGALDLPEGNSFFLCDSTGRVIYRETALEAEEADGAHAFTLSEVDGEWYVRADHPMEKGHFLTFFAQAADRGVEIVKLWPEQVPEARFAKRGVGSVLYACCNRHGLFRVK